MKAILRKLGVHSRVQAAVMAVGQGFVHIAVAESTDNLLCQDTGIPMYNFSIGRKVFKDMRQRRCLREGAVRQAPVPTTRPRDAALTGLDAVLESNTIGSIEPRRTQTA